MKILNVVGARPNFMKIAPLIRAMRPFPELQGLLVHTGQHYDSQMSDVFFADLAIPPADINLGVGSGSHAEQTAEVMVRFEPVVLEQKPDLVLVVGDVNSTLACSLVAAKLNVPVAHVEAGIRSFDRTMPEEINRILTDVVSEYLFSPTNEASENLRKEGIPESKIYMVGNIMIDTLLESLPVAAGRQVWSWWGLSPKEYAVLTLHRPANVDDPATLTNLVSALVEISIHLPVVFPIHPRTKKMIHQAGLENAINESRNIFLSEPLGYLDFLSLFSQAQLVLTDSGGIQTEATVLGVPCLTMRTSTEYPLTLTQGTNTLVGSDPHRVLTEARRILNGDLRPHTVPESWDGKTSARIAQVLREHA